MTLFTIQLEDGTFPHVTFPGDNYIKSDMPDMSNLVRYYPVQLTGALAEIVEQLGSCEIVELHMEIKPLTIPVGSNKTSKTPEDWSQFRRIPRR